MDRLMKPLSFALALIALAAVYWQHRQLGLLEARLAARPASAAAGDGEAPASPRSAGDTSELRPLERRLSTLEQTVARIFQLQLSGGKEDDKRASATPRELEEVGLLREDVDALLTGAALDSETGRAQLHQIVQKAQEEFQEQRHEQRRKFNELRLKEQLERLAKEAGINTHQVERLTAMKSEERTRRHDLFRAARRGEIPMEQAMAKRKELRQQTDQQIRELLSEEQYQAYDKTRRERRGGGRGRH